MKTVQKNIVIHTSVVINEHIKTPSKVRTFLCFTAVVFISFFLLWDLRAPLVDHRQTLPHDW